MPTIAELFDLALRYHQDGDIGRAEPLYRQVLVAAPSHADANHLLGVLAHQTGRHEEAVEFVRRAIALSPLVADYHFNLGTICGDLGQTGNAAACYQQALSINPQHGGALVNLGSLLRDQKQLSEAARCFRQALSLNPNDAGLHSNLGVVLKEQGDFAGAIEYLRQALRLDPKHANAQRNLGNAFRDLGHLFKQQGKRSDAKACYENALEHTPDCLETLNNLGAVLFEQGLPSQAVASFRRAVQLKPDASLFHGNLGVMLNDMGKWDEAIASYRRALELDPRNTVAQDDLLHLLAHLCLWPELDELLARMKEAARLDPKLALPEVLSPITLLNLAIPATAQEQLQCARKEYRKSALPPNERIALPPRRPGKTKITLGYLSADYRKHAVAFLIAELFELHDRQRFEVNGYSYGPDDGSPLRRRIAGAFDSFVDLRNIPDSEAAQRIAADGVDILIDLTGYTTNHRMSILSRCPAPIQVNYLGYPGTMGASVIDYIIVDDFIVPADQQPFYTEKLIHLPCYQVNDSKREISEEIPTRAECGLPAQGFVFCDFNNTFKINPKMFEVWMDLLKAVPGSVLWLFEGNRWVSANLRRETALRGVVPERLIFAPKKPLPEHLARHRLADLFLDTFPYGALTTASDALWAGVPLLTLSGATFVSRVAGSCLKTLGLPELITTSFEDYQAMALELARNPDMLADLRTRLADRRVKSSLFDSTKFTRDLEQAYIAMWENHERGLRFQS